MAADLHSNETSDLDQTLAEAFDRVWDRFVAIEGAGAATPDNRGRLAARLVVLTMSGAADLDTLVDPALLYLRAFMAASRLSTQSQTPQADPPSMGSYIFEPDALDSMAVALERCMDEMPRASSSLRSILSAAIFRKAAEGERSPERLQSHALDVLRRRA
jgi:hypothetical protein